MDSTAPREATPTTASALMTQDESDTRSGLRPVDSRDGLIWVDPASKIQVTNPKGADGRYAVIAVPGGDNVVVTINGNVVTGTRVVEETDHIQMRLPVLAPQAATAITVSPDGMEAVLTVTYKPGERRIVRPTTPAPRLVIALDVYPIEPMRITLAQVRTELTRSGVSVGVIASDQIQAFLDRGESGTLVIARGTAPIPGAGSVELLRPDDAVGLWFVEPGTIIGRRRPALPQPGVTVTGEECLAPVIAPGREVRLGPGVALMNRGAYLVASAKGYVVYESQVIDVVSQHEMDNIAPDPEALVVIGDLTVRGNIVDRHVVITGNLVVAGDVRGAQVATGGAVDVRGMTDQAKITVGIGRYAHQYGRRHITRLIDGLYDLELTIKDLERQLGPEARDLGAVIARLIPTKFADVVESLGMLESALAWPMVRWHDTLGWAIRQIRQQMDEDLSDSMVRASLWALRSELEMMDLDEVVEEIPVGRHSMPVRLNAVNHSEIDGVGTMTLDSIHTSRIVADAVIVQGEVVGGFLTAQHRIEAWQLGDPQGTETSVEVLDADGEVAAETAFPGVMAAVGGERYTLTSPRFSASWPPKTWKGGDNQ